MSDIPALCGNCYLYRSDEEDETIGYCRECDGELASPTEKACSAWGENNG